MSPASGAPTLEDVARIAGVSRSTASRAINGGLRVSSEAQEAVARAVAVLGYVPNPAARSLVTNRTGTIALVIPEPDETVLTDPFFAQVLPGVSAVIEEEDYQLVLVMARPGRGIARAERYLNGHHTDGAVVASHHRDDRIESSVLTRTVPVVLIGRPWIEAHTPWVDAANRDGARMATEYLVGTGARRVAILAGRQDMTAGAERLAGSLDALDAAGLRPVAVTPAEFTRAGGMAAMEQALAQAPDLDGVVAASDLVAAGALTTLAAYGRRVPQDVRIIGYDDLGVARDTVPQLTTVTNPAREMGRMAARMLLDLIAGHTSEVKSVVLPGSLVVRDST